MVEFETIKSEEVKFGRNNFIEISRKKAKTNDRLGNTGCLLEEHSA